MQKIVKIRIIMKLKNLSYRLQFKKKKSVSNNTNWKNYVEITVHRKPDKMNEKLRNL